MSDGRRGLRPWPALLLMLSLLWGTAEAVKPACAKQGWWLVVYWGWLDAWMLLTCIAVPHLRRAKGLSALRCSDAIALAAPGPPPGTGMAIPLSGPPPPHSGKPTSSLQSPPSAVDF